MGAERVRITTFTDPMMGLSYEMEPVYRHLEAVFGDHVELRWHMGLLVRDARDFMTPAERALDEEAAFAAYNTRLAGIYLAEEPLGGVPMDMSSFALFSPDHASTLPLCLAYHAAAIASPGLAYAYLVRLRFATVAQGRRTTLPAVCREVAAETGVDLQKYDASLGNDGAQAALREDLSLMAALGIHCLPACLVEGTSSSVLLNGLCGYDELCGAISRVGGGKPQGVTASHDALRAMLARQKLVSREEICAAFGLQREEARELAEQVVAHGYGRKAEVGKGWFLIVD